MELRAAWVALLMSTALAACGGSDPEDEARAVLDDYVAAVADEDPNAICELWSPWAARDARIFFGIPSDDAPDCSDQTFGYFVPLLDTDPEVTQVSASDEAVIFEVDGLSDEIEIRKFSVEWKVNTLCVGSSCITADETPVEGPIGGDDLP